MWARRFSAVQELITRKGFSLQQLDAAIAAYADINVWSLNPSRTKLTLAGDSK